MWLPRCFVLLSLLLSALPPLVAHAQDGPPVSPGLRVELGATTAPLPVIATKVRGEVSGFVAEVHVTQTFVNPFDDFIEATYVFPLPEQAAVHAMVMHLPDRDVVAEIKQREEAQQIYDEAVSAGRTAALLDQERPNLFTQKVGNIPPGDVIEIELSYVEALPYDGGVSSFVFPTVVGPRYIPGQPLVSGAGTTRVSDAARITPGILGELESTPQRVDLELTLKPGLDIRALHSPSHDIEVVQPFEDQATVKTRRSDSVPNKDFILNVDLRGAQPKLALLADRQPGKPGYATLQVQPPALPQSGDVVAKDLFFVVDTSGSMSGEPLDAAKRMVVEALNNMNGSDRFTIMRFDDHVSELSAKPLTNTPANVKSGLEFIAAMDGGGGTEMISGVRRALEGKPEAGRVRIVFFLTDGYIGNDDEILAAVASENVAHARLFSMGVGSSVNRYLLAGMARLGRGEMQVMRQDQAVEPFVQRFYSRVRNPLLTDIELAFEGVQVERADADARLPDLFDSQPLLLNLRYQQPGKGTLVLRGRYGGKRYEQRVAIELPDAASRPAIASLWARGRIAALDDEEVVRPGGRKEEITALGLEHHLMTKYTSFVAVDRAMTRPQHAPLIPVEQRLPLPEGMSRQALETLSRHEIPPGDPFIDVAAPADARRVTAYFPFGLVKALSYDVGRDLWRTRFLVPEGIADGDYLVVIAIELADGKLLRRTQPFHLDSEAAEFDFGWSAACARPGTTLTLSVDSIEPASEVYVHAPTLHWWRAPLAPEGSQAIDWQRLLRVPANAAVGSHEVTVVVRDRAGNRFAQNVTLVVSEHGEEETCSD